MAATLPFDIEVVHVGTGPLSQRAVVLTPLRNMVFGRTKLNEVNTGTELNARDRWLLTEVERCKARIAVLRSVNTYGERVWAVDPELSESEATQLGYILTRGLLPVHRRLVALGITLFAHTDWGLKETEAMRGGVARMLEALAQRPRAHAAIQEIDLWILKHFIFHFGMPYQHIMDKVLPEHLKLIDTRTARIAELVTRLPNAAID